MNYLKRSRNKIEQDSTKTESNVTSKKFINTEHENEPNELSEEIKK